MTTNNNVDRHVREMMKWHFNPQTGSKFWLSRRNRLDFDPILDIHGLHDLSRFPQMADELRDTPIEDLIPRGLNDDERSFVVYESGGTTGAPKRFLMFDRWFDDYMEWENSHYPNDGTGNTLAVAPSGPHMLGDYSRRIAQGHGGARFTVDFDPRWVKRLIAEGQGESANCCGS